MWPPCCSTLFSLSFSFKHHLHIHRSFHSFWWTKLKKIQFKDRSNLKRLRLWRQIKIGYVCICVAGWPFVILNFFSFFSFQIFIHPEFRIFILKVFIFPWLSSMMMMMWIKSIFFSVFVSNAKLSIFEYQCVCVVHHTLLKMFFFLSFNNILVFGCCCCCCRRFFSYSNTNQWICIFVP